MMSRRSLQWLTAIGTVACVLPPNVTVGSGGVLSAPNSARPCEQTCGFNCRCGGCDSPPCIVSRQPFRKINETEVHTGVDLRGRAGDVVVAPISGYVRHVGWHNGYGAVVIIESDDKERSVIVAHLLCDSYCIYVSRIPRRTSGGILRFF